MTHHSYVSMKNIPGEGSGPHFDFIFLKHFVNLKPDQGCTLKGEILSPPQLKKTYGFVRVTLQANLV